MKILFLGLCLLTSLPIDVSARECTQDALEMGRQNAQMACYQILMPEIIIDVIDTGEELCSLTDVLNCKMGMQQFLRTNEGLQCGLLIEAKMPVHIGGEVIGRADEIWRDYMRGCNLP